MTRTFSADNLNFGDSASTIVCSDSLRFIVPVPKLAGGGEPLATPAGASDSFTDDRGRPLEGRGIVFFNPDDDCWQAAPGDGSAVIVIGPVSEDQGAALQAKVKSLSADPERLTIDQIKDVIHYAIGTVKVRSAYNSTRAFVAEHMTPVDLAAPPGFGLHRRQARDCCPAVFVPGGGRFLGPAATPQLFKDGAVILKHGDDVRLLQPKSFEASYSFPDGRPVHVSDLKVQDPGL